MADLNERLRGIDRVPMPDLWDQASGRVELGQRGHAPGTNTRRVVTVVVALVIAGAGFTALLLAFRGNGRNALTSGPRADGVIATLERGASSEPGVENIDLVAIDPTTGARVDLTPGPAAETTPVWSPDGTRVAFLRTTASAQGSQVTLEKGLYAMNADGSDLREIYPCTDPAQCEISEFAWSPDDRYLAWTLELGGKATGDDLRILDNSTGQVAGACPHNSCGQYLSQLAWSPNSSQLAFSDGGGITPGLGGPLPSSIWLVDTDGMGLTRLTPGRLCDTMQGALNSCAADTWPGWSPDGNTLTFLHQPTGGAIPSKLSNPSLVRMTPDGKDRREFALCPAASSCEASSTPQWSPDGDSVLFATGSEQSALIHLLDPANGAVTDIPAHGESDCVNPVEPSWSPDGKQITFIGGPGRTANLCVLPRQGGTPRVLVPNLPGYYLTGGTGFTWLPAGAIDMSSAHASDTTTPKAPGRPLPAGTIAFASSNGSNQEDAGVQIWSMASDGSHVRQLTTGPSRASAPAISPDGSNIAFTRSGEVWLMNLDGSGQHQLTDLGGSVWSPMWSPDGTQLMFRLYHGRDQAPDGIYVMGADGSHPHIVARGNTFGQTWGPGDTSITYSADSSSSNSLHLKTLDLTTGTVRSLLDLPGDQDSPAWSPDGSMLAFAWTSAGGTGLYVVNADGSNLQRVVGAPFTAGDSGLGISWSPDGTWLSFEGIDDTHGPQIYAVRIDGTGLQRLTDQRGFIVGSSVYGITGNPSWGP